MKEFLPNAQFNGEGLTKPIGHPTLDVRGNIFMPEPGNGDLPPKQPEKIPDDQPKEQTTREAFLGQIRTSEEAEKAWRDLYKEQGIDFDKLSVDERGIVDVAIRQGTIRGKASVGKKLLGF